MPELDDQQLLAEFTGANSETAFAALVERYVNLVYSTALRFTGNPQAAEEISQAVFIIFARKAAGLRHGTVLSGWLYQTARLTAANYVKHEVRRQRREQEAYMRSTLNESGSETWNEIAPLLDEAMGGLGETDHNAVVLKFFENKSAREVAVALKLTEAAAHKRVNRALEKLRKFLAKRGVVSTTAIIAGAVSANSVHATPAGLANTLSTVALAKGAAASASTLTLVKGALKVMAWSNTKTAIVAGLGILFIAGTATIAVRQIEERQTPVWQKKYDLSVLDTLPPQIKIRPSLPSTLQSGMHVWGANEHGALGLGQDVPDLLEVAYSVSPAQLIWNCPVPGGKYDFIANLRSQLDNQKAGQEGIQKMFGLTVRPETIETNVLIMAVKSRHAPGLRPPSATISFNITTNSFSSHNQTIVALGTFLESYLGTVVVDQTQLVGNHDVDFTWDSTPEGLKQALLDQVGLELIPTNMPVEMLVVGKAE